MQRELLTQPEVADLLAEEGAAGLGIFVAVNLYLAHCEGGWGAFNGCQLSTMAVQLKKHRSDVKRVICDYGLFVIEDTRFTSHWMQQLFGNNAAKMLQGCSTPACSYNLRAEDIDTDKLAELTEDYVASEIAYIVNDAAMQAAFADVPISQETLVRCIKNTPPGKMGAANIKKIGF